jgi:hypothetical protein
VVDAAATMRDARTFLAWARYPTFLVDRRGGVTTVHFIDLRYARAPGPGFGTFAVPMTVGQVARMEARAEGLYPPRLTPLRSNGSAPAR